MDDQTRFSLSDGMDLAGVDVNEVWWRYVAIGGSRDPASVASCLAEQTPCDPHEHDLIAHVLNEIFLDRGLSTFPVGYSDAPAAVQPTAPRRSPAETRRESRSTAARQQAALARLRSAAAARQAAALHATAAQLMQTSGQLQFARRAQSRSQTARRRATESLRA